MAETTFTAKDANGANILIAAQQNPDDGALYPINMPTTRPIISQFLDTVGDGSGTFEATGDYSSVADDFYIQAPAGELWAISRILITGRDTGNFRPEYYDVGGPLTNGIRLIHEENGVENDLTSQSPVKTLAEWGSYCYDVNIYDFGAGDEYFDVRWSFFRAGTFVDLAGDTNDKLIVRLNDDFTGLNSHRFLVQGFKIQGDA